MNSFYNASAAAGRQVLRSTPRTRTNWNWTCRQCCAKEKTVKEGARGYANRAGSGNANHGKRKSNGKVLFAAASGGALGASTLAFGDDIKHAYGAAERSGRVASTLAVCINE